MGSRLRNILARHFVSEVVCVVMFLCIMTLCECVHVCEGL